MSALHNDRDDDMKNYWFIALACFVLSDACYAQTEMLTYTGSAFTQADFSGNVSIAEAQSPPQNTGSIVLSAPLGDNLTNSIVMPASWAFDSTTLLGGVYLNSGNPELGLTNNYATFQFSTDLTGAITQWDVEIHGLTIGTSAPSGASLSITTSGDTYSSFASNSECAKPPGVPIPCYNISESNDAAGQWSQSVAPAPEIDPGMAGSALTLLAGMLAIVRSRRQVTNEDGTHVH
jgi:hypothetical protein